MKRTLFVTMLFIFISSYSFSLSPEFDVSCTSAILINGKTGDVLFEKNAHSKAYPASTTKILTALIALSSEPDLNKEIIPSHKAVYSVPIGSSNAYFSEGEKLSLEQVLYGLLLPSGNDAANIIAENISGSTQKFADLMNETAKSLGALNSNFKNPSGIHDDEHYTTAYDLSLIAQEAMRNSTFREIVSTCTYDMPATNRSSVSRKFPNTNQLLLPGQYNFKEATGIKTGYTSQAGNCLISSASKNNIELIVVVLGGNNIQGDKSAIYTDTINLLNFGFDNYYNEYLLNAGSCVKQINPNKSGKDILDLIAESPIDVLIENGKSPDFKQIITLRPNISAPIKSNDVLGTVSYYIGDKQVGISNLLARTDIEKEPWYFIFGRVLLSILLSIIILCIMLRIFNEIRKRIRKGKR